VRRTLDLSGNLIYCISAQAGLHAFQLEQFTASHTEHEDISSPDETANGKLAEYTISSCMS
jgi:hypothetical protein